ncbi:unnamed protein product [Ilex paraguariensis]|uniref:Remorin C-terminal domain-containing protein n=1 Tax=Ilex paraguariensis TaxID=185542 RepID=A0ABC8RIF4_9AQUA
MMHIRDDFETTRASLKIPSKLVISKLGKKTINKKNKGINKPEENLTMSIFPFFKVEVERMRGRAHDKLMNKLAAARHKAEEKRVAAEAKRNRQAAKTEHEAEYIRKTGRIPSSFSCCGLCS